MECPLSQRLSLKNTTALVLSAENLNPRSPAHVDTRDMALFRTRCAVRRELVV